jgi:V8-like Glu-specific endopeptidase
MQRIVAGLALAVAVAGCSPTGSGYIQPTMSSPTAPPRIPTLAAPAVTLGPRAPAEPAVPADPALHTGAIFDTRTGQHFCTGIVVGRDLVMTAAHCIYPFGGSFYERRIRFVPQWRRGHKPVGQWAPARMLVPHGWIRYGDPDLDVGFMSVKPLHGRHIGDLLGVTALAFNTGFNQTVRVIGYPSDRTSVATCVNRARRYSATQLKISCHNFTMGTSGAPWVTRHPVSEVPAVIAVLGGHLGGGNSPHVSYAAYLGSDIQALYARAVKTL